MRPIRGGQASTAYSGRILQAERLGRDLGRFPGGRLFADLSAGGFSKCNGLSHVRLPCEYGSIYTVQLQDCGLEAWRQAWAATEDQVYVCVCVCASECVSNV